MSWEARMRWCRGRVGALGVMAVAVATVAFVAGCSGGAGTAATIMEIRPESVLYCVSNGTNTYATAPDLVAGYAEGDDVWIDVEAGVVTSIAARSSSEGSTAVCTRSFVDEEEGGPTPDPASVLVVPQSSDD